MSLRYRIALTIFVLEAAMMFFVLRTTLSSSLDDTTSELARSERHIVDLVADLSRPALLTEDYGGLQSSLTKTAQHARIVRVIVFDHHGRAVAASQPEDIGTEMRSLPDLGIHHRIRQEVTTPAGLLGTVVAEFSNAEVVAASDRVRRLGLVIALAGMSVIAIVGGAIGVLLTRRLRRLSDTASNLGRGDLSARTDVTGSDELGQLGLTLNEMAERVEADQAELNERAGTMRALYNLTASRTMTTAEGMRQILELGCEQLGLDVGVVARVDGEDLVIEYAAGTGDGVPEVGERIALAGSGLEHVVGADQTVALADGGPDASPRALLATPLHGAEGAYGALGFSSTDPRASDFSASDRQLIELMARWVASQLEHSELRARLMVSDRLASAGMLAAGVAHEINNPLTFVSANLELLARRAGKDAPSGPLIAQSIEGVERIRNVVSDLAHLGRSSPAETTLVDVREVLESSIRMAWHEIKYRAEVERELDERVCIHGDPSRLGQLFLNLIVNAAQAIEVGDKEHNWIRVTAAREGDRAVVTVRDSGEGIDEGMLPRVLDPFVTSRQGSGSGLGLFLCNQIVTSMGGRLAIESTRGEGTTVRVELPAAEPVASSEASRATEEASERGEGAARVLIVDDEELIRRALSLALDGHQVDTVGSAREAIEILLEREYDIVFCDLIMPQLTGMDLYEHVARHRPELTERIVFMSGDAFTESARAFVEQKSVTLLQKPFPIERLEELIAEMGPRNPPA